MSAVKRIDALVSGDSILNYLREQLADALADLDRFGADDRYALKKLDAVIACKEMAEVLLRCPVNLRKDGNVTVGF